MHFTIHADGGSRGNPGPSGAGAMIRDALGNSVASVSQFLGTHTNNFAEYEAVIIAFETLKKLIPENKLSKTDVVVKMDSERIRACGISYPKIKYIKGIAQAVIEKKLSLGKLPLLSDEEVVSELIKLNGVGRWTAEMLLIFSSSVFVTYPYIVTSLPANVEDAVVEMLILIGDVVIVYVSLVVCAVYPAAAHHIV